MKRLAGAVLALCVTAAGAAEKPGDFAYAMPVATEGGEAFYQVELPAALYRGVAHADLRDVRVFNAQDETVPHAIRPRAPGSSAAPETVRLPFFPLRGEPGREVEDLHVRVQKRSDGTVVDIRSGDKNAGRRHVTRGYLVDASHARQGIQALLFEWKTPREGFSGKVSIEGSDDLARWNTMVRDASLLDLEFGGHRLEKKRIDIRPPHYRYLRVSWPQSQKEIEFSAIRAEHVPAHMEPQRAWLALSAPAAGKNPGEHEYEVGGAIPFDRLRVELPQANTVAQIQIFTRDKPSDEWRALASALVYRLRRDGSEVASPEIAVSGRSARTLLLRVDQRGGGIGSGAPAVYVGWLPQQLVFAARGEGPFRLAYGAHTAQAAAFPINSLLPGYGTDRQFGVKPAKLGEAVTLAGEKQRRAPIDYRRWILWMSLILGVAVVGVMAYGLFRQMARGQAEKPPPNART